jgi:MoaA/NifB/PqqE/SkfB family radical SAM enzyme
MKIVDMLYMARLFGHHRTRLDDLLPKEIVPKAVTVKLTERCNSRCLSCNYWKQDLKDLITTKRVIDLIDEIAELGVIRLRFSGGEPLLREDFFLILEHAASKGFGKITMATNGLLVGKRAEAINRSSLTDLGVSVDGLRETNDLMRGVPGYFDTVMKGLTLIKNKRITIMSNLNGGLYKDLPELLRICEEAGYLWDYNLLDDTPSFFHGINVDSIIGSNNEVDKLFEVIRKYLHLKCMRRLSDIQLNYAYNYLKKTLKQEPHCYMGFMELFINSQGDVLSGCHVLPPVDNILQKGLLEIVGSKAYLKRVKNMVAGKCPGCTCGYGVNEALKNMPKYFMSRILQGKGVLP